MEIKFVEGHRACSKELKPFIDIFKVYKKYSNDVRPAIDFVDSFIINTYNDTVVLTSIENIKNIFKPVIDKLTWDDMFNLYTFDKNELELFILGIDAPKKEFLTMSWVYEENLKRFKLSVWIKSKVSGMVINLELPLIKERDKKMYDLHLKYNIYFKKHCVASIDFDEMKKDVIEDLSGGEVVIINHKDLIIARMMSNILFRPLKDNIFDFSYTLNNDGTALCRLEYQSYTGSNPPIKIKQIFSTFTYKGGK